VAVAAVAFGGACSSSGSTADGGVATNCDPSKCAVGNQCVKVGEENKCRLPCGSHNDCPTNYKCLAGGVSASTSASTNYCAADTLQITAKATGQWGYACNPQQGVDNADCDGAQGFKCLAKSSTDGSAYCTRYDCSKNTDCKAGWYCGAVRSSPNAGTSASENTWGTDTRVCLPQTFCAPCETDLDCSQKSGVAHCIAGTDGAKFCATSCERDDNCDRWADCKAGPAGSSASDKNVCTPRAGVCKGDGTFCTPCRADSDCKAGGGVCLQSDTGTNEQFCSGVSTVDCKVVDKKLVHGCPTPGGQPATFGCQTSKTDPGAPYNACYGLVKFGKDSNDYTYGCWTRPYAVTSTPPDAGVKDAAKEASTTDASTPDAAVVDATAADAAAD
jgi:hypothetical protein